MENAHHPGMRRLSLALRAKQANADPVEAANREAIRQVLGVGAAGLGLGAGVASLGALQRMLTAPETTPGTAPGLSTVVTLSPPPSSARQRARSWIEPASAPRGRTYAVKTAGDTPDMLGSAADAVYDYGVKPLGLDTVMDVPFAPATSPTSKWWHGGAALGAGAAGVAAGSTLVNWLASKEDKARRNAGLQAAEHEYLTALSDLRSPKLAAVDDARAALRKTAGAGEPDQVASAHAVGNILGLPLNVAGMMATGAAIPSAVAAYHYVRDNGQPRALRDALLMRQRMQQYRQPAPIQMVLPEPAAGAA